MQKPAVKAGTADVTQHLNAALCYALTGINQYFLHARMLKHQGDMALADRAYKHSLDTMRHADRVVERILSLGGLPNVQELARMHIGDTKEAMLRGDLKLEHMALLALDAAIAACAAAHDDESAALLENIRASVRGHGEFLQQQLQEKADA